MRAPLAALFLLLWPFALPGAAGATTFDNGMVNVVSAPLGEGAIVDDGPGGSQTTLQLVPGGSIGSGPFGIGDLLALGQSRVEISGGTVDARAILRDTSDGQVSGGQIGSVETFDDATLELLGGSFGYVTLRGDSVTEWSGGNAFQNALIADDARLELSGGGVTEFGFIVQDRGHLEMTAGGTGAGGVSVSGNGTANISGGGMGGFLARDSASVVFNGGSVGLGSFFSGLQVRDDSDVRIVDITFRGALSQGLNVTGTSVLTIEGGQGWDCAPDCFGFFSADDAVIRVVGSSFNLPFGEVVPGFGTLTGTLADGRPIDIPFARLGNGRIVLVPEAGTVLLLGAGLAALGSGRRRRRPIG